MFAQTRLGSRLPAIVLLGAGLSFALFAVAAGRRPYFDWDLALSASLQGISQPAFHALMYWVSYPGNQLNAWIFGLGVGLTLLLARKRSAGAVLLAGTSSGALFNSLLKAWVDRPRPAEPLVRVWIDYPAASFPSGHVMFYIELFGFLAWLAWRSGHRLTALLCGVPVLLVGVSRVYLGAHWSSDVLGGYLGGLLWLALMVWAHLRLERRDGSRTDMSAVVSTRQVD